MKKFMLSAVIIATLFAAQGVFANKLVDAPTLPLSLSLTSFPGTPGITTTYNDWINGFTMQPTPGIYNFNGLVAPYHDQVTIGFWSDRPYGQAFTVQQNSSTGAYTFTGGYASTGSGSCIATRFNGAFTYTWDGKTTPSAPVNVNIVYTSCFCPPSAKNK